jgi:hypothetical protein
MNHNPLLEKAFSPRLHRAVRIAFPRSWMGRMGEKLAHKLSWGALYPVTLIWLVLYQLWNLLPLTATVTLLTVQSLVAGWVFKNLLQREPDISVPPFTNRPVNAGMLYEFARRTGFPVVLRPGRRDSHPNRLDSRALRIPHAMDALGCQRCSGNPLQCRALAAGRMHAEQA